MEHDDIIKMFFSEELEKEYNKYMQNEPSLFDEKAMLDYVNKICSIPLRKYIEYIAENPTHGSYSSNDITQSSKPENCHVEMCKIFKNVGYKGLTTQEIGRLLHDDGFERSANTLQRYGRDQVTAARQLGLTCLKGSKWYLSAIGRIFLLLDSDIKIAIMGRCILRNVYYEKIMIQATKHDVIFEDTCYNLSDSTIERRRSGVAYLFNIVKDAAKENIFHELILPKSKRK